MKLLFKILVIVWAVVILCLLNACGSSHKTILTVSPMWEGGLYDVWVPEKPKAVIILHQGHNCFDDCYPAPDDNMIPIAEQFAEAGFIVYGFEMPPFPHSEGPIEYYYESTLKFVESLSNRYPIYMVGISGGGWTTTVITALSDRIVHGYSISGDAPFDIRPRAEQPADVEWEQLNPPTGSYRNLYDLAGKRLTHIYNYNEAHEEGYTGAMLSCEATPECEAGYFYIWDYVATDHYISNWTVEYIIDDINRVRG